MVNLMLFSHYKLFIFKFLDFATVLNHENMAITQITAYDPVSNISVVEVDHESKLFDAEKT